MGSVHLAWWPRTDLGAGSKGRARDALVTATCPLGSSTMGVQLGLLPLLRATPSKFNSQGPAAEWGAPLPRGVLLAEGSSI